MKVSVQGTVLMVASRRMTTVRDAFEVNLRNALGDDPVDALVLNRVKRDGPGAHLTLLNTLDGALALRNMTEAEDLSDDEAWSRLSDMAQVLPDNWKAKGLGMARSGTRVTYYVVVDWPFAREFRKAAGVAPAGQDFHITLGFGPEGDVHGVRKNQVLSLAELAVA